MAELAVEPAVVDGADRDAVDAAARPAVVAAVPAATAARIGRTTDSASLEKVTRIFSGGAQDNQHKGGKDHAWI